MKKIALLLGLVLGLSSCIGIKSAVTFNRDGSGIITFEYRISKMLTEMGGDDGADVPLPISEEELKSSLADSPNLSLKKVSQRETEEDLYITAEIEFKNVEEFTEVDSFSAMPMKLVKKGNEFTFTQLISEGTGSDSEDSEEMDEETKKMMESFFAGYELSFTVTAPTSIQDYNLGQISDDKKSVMYSIPLLEMNSLEEETVLEVRWRI